MFVDQEGGGNFNEVEKKDNTQIAGNVLMTLSRVILVMGKSKGSGYIHIINTICVK